MNARPPIIPVITPIGNSLGEIIVLAIVSHRMRNPPPARNDEISNILKSEPTSNLINCGIINPTKHIIPATETQIPVSSDAKINSILMDISVFIPKCRALFSPKRSAFKGLINKYDNINPVTEDISEIKISVLLSSSREPIIQNKMP